MKNSDMKIIAIILSIALFFTIITSNAVSIASVILLAKDGGTQTEAPADDQGGQAANQPAGNQVNSNNTQTNNSQNNTTNNTQTNNTQTNNTQTNNTQTNNTQNNNASNNTSNDAANNNAAADDNAIMKDPLAAYQKAIKEITDTGAAGYNKKAWQTIEGDGLSLSASNPIVNAILGALKGTLTNLIKGFMTDESAATDDVQNKGSDEAKDRMPLSNCSASACTATAVKDGDNYVVTIVMNDQINPAKTDTDGLRVMSKDILYMEDVVDTIQNDETVSAIVKELKKGEINYKQYTIKAVMTADGKFVSIDHDCIADLQADIVVGQGDVSGSGQLGFHTRYTNFVY